MLARVVAIAAKWRGTKLDSDVTKGNVTEEVRIYHLFRWLRQGSAAREARKKSSIMRRTTGGFGRRQKQGLTAWQILTARD